MAMCIQETARQSVTYKHDKNNQKLAYITLEKVTNETNRVDYNQFKLFKLTQNIIR